MRDPKILRDMVAMLGAAAAMIGPAAANESTRVQYAKIPEGAFSVVAEVRAKPGKEKALREATLPLVPLVRGDPKNLVYFLQEDRDTPGRFIFYEIFVSREDFEAHNAMPYVQAWLAKLPELAEGGVRAMRMEILGQIRR